MTDQPVEQIALSAERLLAAILRTVDKVSVSVENLTDDYSNYQIAVHQEENGDVTFYLTDEKEDS